MPRDLKRWFPDLDNPFNATAEEMRRGMAHIPDEDMVDHMYREIKELVGPDALTLSNVELATRLREACPGLPPAPSFGPDPLVVHFDHLRPQFKAK